MLLCVLALGELAHIRVSEGLITWVLCTTLTACVLSLLNFLTIHIHSHCWPVPQVLPFPLLLGHKWRGKAEQIKECAQGEEEWSAVILILQTRQKVKSYFPWKSCLSPGSSTLRSSKSCCFLHRLCSSFLSSGWVSSAGKNLCLLTMEQPEVWLRSRDPATGGCCGIVWLP